MQKKLFPLKINRAYLARFLIFAIIIGILGFIYDFAVWILAYEKTIPIVEWGLHILFIALPGVLLWRMEN
jgi:hypothetical protein